MHISHNTEHKTALLKKYNPCVIWRIDYMAHRLLVHGATDRATVQYTLYSDLRPGSK